VFHPDTDFHGLKGWWGEKRLIFLCMRECVCCADFGTKEWVPTTSGWCHPPPFQQCTASWIWYHLVWLSRIASEMVTTSISYHFSYCFSPFLCREILQIHKCVNDQAVSIRSMVHCSLFLYVSSLPWYPLFISYCSYNFFQLQLKLLLLSNGFHCATVFPFDLKELFSWWNALKFYSFCVF